MMPISAPDIDACANCGVDVRENTLFCYNCGSRLVAEVVVEGASGDAVRISKAANEGVLDSLSQQLEIESKGSENERLARAAEKRRKSRLEMRRSNEFTWEATDDRSSFVYLAFAFTVAIIAAAIVFLIVIWK